MNVNELCLLRGTQTFGFDKNVSGRPPGDKEKGFGAVLQEKTERSLSFSKHAVKRLDERGITVDRDLMSDLEHAVEGARKKGAKDVAVIGPRGVFIINVPNHVVVTTMAQDETKEQILTNIDSAVLI